MCRHLAYLGPSIALEDLLLTPPHSLVQQATAARFQTSGAENPDGYGVGWYDSDGTVHRRRSATPIGADDELPAFAHATHTTAALAAVRLASPGSPVEESGNAPFTDGHWLFSLNGIVDDFHDGRREKLLAQISPERAAGIEGAADSEVLFALALDLLDEVGPAEALAEVVARAKPGRLNLLLTDGRHIVATAWGNSLFVRQPNGARDGALVASEPLDDDAGWRRVADRTLVEADAATISETTL